ncbi:hypothetical protein [Streptomyces lasiicapitis]|uniref:hypothetical protein n=1 Tax=Streptomyces lasiicapitis TaxID=1923961 RepID=UPI001E6045A8|nr:hypothetical protein [Streptomyces lasiicapitis]
MAIQPSYGNPIARRHWRDTLDQEVPFGSEEYAATLSGEQRDALLRIHPTESARFWGATSVQDKNMARLRMGDVVLFTGQNLVRGIGEVGLTFRNAEFADAMWTPDPDKGSWRNVYSLLSFRHTEIPYSEIWDLPSFNAGDNFMGLRVLEGDKADEILQGLGIGTVTEARRKLARDAEVANAIATGTRVVPVEGVHTSTAAYRRDEREIQVLRAEALLVNEYKATLTGVEVTRLRTPSGITDLHVTGPDGTEVIEAKSSGDHIHVRAALAQLLDYAPHSPLPADRLSALFPVRPAAKDITLLHRYGIDCLYRLTPHTFERIVAPDEARMYMRKIWAGVGIS